jgi:hypothetical protein
LCPEITVTRLYQGEPVMPTKLREIPARAYDTQARPEADFATMSIWLMICLINTVILFGLY